MKITFRQSGGFAGLSRGCELVSSELPEDERKLLADLLSRARLRDRKKPKPHKGADAMQYRIQIEDEQGHFEVTFDEMTLPEPARPLVVYLQTKSKAVPLR